MSQQLQLFYERTSKSKQELKELLLMIKNELLNSRSYQAVNEEIKTLQEKRKKIVDDIKMEFGSEASKIDILKLDIENDRMLMADKAIADLIAGNKVEVTDKDGNRYGPIFSVKFKKI